MKFVLEKIISEIYPKKPVLLHKPFLPEEEIFYFARNVFKSGNISTSGELTVEFERKISDLLNVPYVIATNSGTSALHIGLKVLNIEGAEVLLPAISYVATANAVLYNNGVPHFVDVDSHLGIDVVKLREYLKKIIVKRDRVSYNKFTKRPVKAIIGVHNLGHPCNLLELKEICREYNLFLVEDAAHAFGSKYAGKYVGTYGDITTFSFNGTKIITTGGGGAIATKDKQMYEKMLSLATVAKDTANKFRYIHKEVAYNYRMPAWNAIIGLAQLKYFDEILAYKRKIAVNYYEKLREVKDTELITPPNNSESVNWLNAVYINDLTEATQNEIMEYLSANNIEVRALWMPLTRQEYLKTFPKMLIEKAYDLAFKTILLPSGW